jgi:hypothetical protein
MRVLGCALALLALAFPTLIGAVLTLAAVIGVFLFGHLALAAVAGAALLLVRLGHRSRRRRYVVLDRKLLRHFLRNL